MLESDKIKMVDASSALKCRRALQHLGIVGLILVLGSAAYGQTAGPFAPDSEQGKILAEWRRMGYRPRTDEVLVQLSPTSNRKLIDFIAQNAEPTKLSVKAGDNLTSLIEQRCGDASSAFFNIRLTQLNPSLQLNPNDASIKRPTILNVPACPKFQFDKPVVTIPGDTLDTLVEKSFASESTKALRPDLTDLLRSAIVARHPELNTAGKLPSGKEITLPFVSEPVLLKLRSGVSQGVFIRELTSLSTGVSGANARVETPPLDAIIIPPIGLSGSSRETNCQGAANNWPFSAQAVANAVRGLPLGNPAIVAVIDTGIEGLTESTFSQTFPEHLFAINEIERNAAQGEIDPDRNYHHRDIVGLQFPVHQIPRASNHPPAPIGKSVYKYWDHGTHIAGLIVGGVQLLAPATDGGSSNLRDQIIKNRVKLKIINVTSQGGQRSEIAQIIPLNFKNALEYALEQSAHVINISLSSVDTLAMPRVLQQANALVVVAAGNDGREIIPGGASIFPGHWSRESTKVITVAASDASGIIADFSNRGADYADIAAPGCKVPSFVGGTPQETKSYSGTSQAAPLVSLAASLLFSAGVTDAVAVRNRILAASDPAPNLEGLVRSAGILNIPKTLSIYDDVVELASEKPGMYLVGRLTHPLHFVICEQDTTIPLSRVRKVSRLAGGKVRYVFLDQVGKPISKVCPIDEKNTLRFIKAGTSEDEAFQIGLDKVRDVVTKMQYPPPRP